MPCLLVTLMRVVTALLHEASVLETQLPACLIVPVVVRSELDIFRATQEGFLDDHVATAAERFELNPFLLKGLLMNESRMNPEMRSRSGRGIASFTPSGVDAVNEMRKRTDSAEPAFTWRQTTDAELSIFAAAELLSYLSKKYGRDGGISAYNGGGQHGRYVRRYGYWGAKKRGLLQFSGSVRMSGRYLLNVLKEANLLRAAAGLPPLGSPTKRLASN